MADGKRTCKKCGCPIEFMLGPNGTAIPVQRVRTVYTTAHYDEMKLEKGKVLNGAGEEVNAAYVSHFETCSDPGRFSRHG